MFNQLKPPEQENKVCEEVMKTQNTPRTREFVGGKSSLNLIKNKPYRKIVHVNGNTAALFFFAYSDVSKEWQPLVGSGYYSFNVIEDLPRFIRRHIDENNLVSYLQSNEVLGPYFENGQKLKSI